MTFNEIKKANPDIRIALFANKDNGLVLRVGLESVEWPSDWPSENITDEWIEGLGIDFFKNTVGDKWENQRDCTPIRNG